MFNGQGAQTIPIPLDYLYFFKDLLLKDEDKKTFASKKPYACEASGSLMIFFEFV